MSMILFNFALVFEKRKCILVDLGTTLLLNQMRPSFPPLCRMQVIFKLEIPLQSQLMSAGIFRKTPFARSSLQHLLHSLFKEVNLTDLSSLIIQKQLTVVNTIASPEVCLWDLNNHRGNGLFHMVLSLFFLLKEFEPWSKQNLCITSPWISLLCPPRTWEQSTAGQCITTSSQPSIKLSTPPRLWLGLIHPLWSTTEFNKYANQLMKTIPQSQDLSVQYLLYNSLQSLTYITVLLEQVFIMIDVIITCVAAYVIYILHSSHTREKM